jgi:hypothetical protein
MAINTETSGVPGKGLLPIDSSGIRIQAPTKFVMEDATGTTIKSPKTVSSTEIDLIVPANAVNFICKPVGADVRIAITDGGTAAAPYYVVKDGTLEVFPVSWVAGNGATSIFLLRDASTDVTLHFRFELVGI